MRTKTMLLSALLGALGSVSVMAQTNVYSLNAVGYINITIYPGFNMISCPLIASPDNTLNTLLNNTNGQYKKQQVWSYTATNSQPYFEEVGSATGWNQGGNTTINPGQGVWFNNVSNELLTITFVGTVPTGPITNVLYANSFNMVSTAVPASGDIVTNSIMNFDTAAKKDQVWMYNAANSQPFTESVAGSTGTNWPTGGDPILPFVGGAFFYLNNQVTNNYWVEDYSVSP
jgi:hypothetical protein